MEKKATSAAENPLYTIDIYTTAVMLTTYGDTSSTRFPISPIDAASVFSAMPVGVTALPQNTWAWSIVGGKELIAIWEPPTTRDIHINGRVIADVPMPAIMFVGHGSKYWVYALRDIEYPTKNSLVYHAPLPNTYTGGGVCVGTVQFPVASAETIHDALKLFWSSGFNDHLQDHRVKMKEGSTNIEACLQSWADAGECDRERLIISNHTITALGELRNV